MLSKFGMRDYYEQVFMGKIAGFENRVAERPLWNEPSPRPTLCGYQAVIKWLSSCEFDLLGRALTLDEAREVTPVAPRIAALILLQPASDAGCQRVTAATFGWNP